MVNSRFLYCTEETGIKNEDIFQDIVCYIKKIQNHLKIKQKVLNHDDFDMFDSCWLINNGIISIAANNTISLIPLCDCSNSSVCNNIISRYGLPNDFTNWFYLTFRLKVTRTVRKICHKIYYLPPPKNNFNPFNHNHASLAITSKNR